MKKYTNWDLENVKIMQEMKLIDNLFNDREHLLEIVNDEESAEEVKDVVKTKNILLTNVDDSLHVKIQGNVVEVCQVVVREDEIIYEANNALVVEQDEKKYDEKFVLTNVLECANNQVVAAKK